MLISASKIVVRITSYFHGCSDITGGEHKRFEGYCSVRFFVLPGSKRSLYCNKATRRSIKAFLSCHEQLLLDCAQDAVRDPLRYILNCSDELLV